MYVRGRPGKNYLVQGLVASLYCQCNYALYTSKYKVGRSQPQELLLMILIDLQDLQEKSNTIF